MGPQATEDEARPAAMSASMISVLKRLVRWK
jgi:hypothetical protein